MEIISSSEARANIKAVMDRVVADKVPIAISRQKGEGVVLIAQSEWDGMMETMHLLSSPANARHLMEGIARLNAGRGEEHELIEP
ncbi:MAG: type II toxin-antitoxin system prevent-host-death family antitoxin [Pseudomonadota bacterium]